MANADQLTAVSDGDGRRGCDRVLASILHVDMDAFFASVEQLENPELKGLPLIVGGDGARGVVASCSYEARAYGVRSAMPSVRAKRLCPQAVFVQGRYQSYEKYSNMMREVFEAFTPRVEFVSLDEAFLDVSGAIRMFGPPSEIAWKIRRAVHDELRLDVSVGVANTKHLAKLASVRAKPRASKQGTVPGLGVLTIEPGDAIAFLHALDVGAIWGVGPKAEVKLQKAGIRTVGELARTPVQLLSSIAGKAVAEHLHGLAWNLDTRQVEPNSEAKSIGHEQTYAKNIHDRDEVNRQLLRLADAVAARLRGSSKAGKNLTVKLRFGSFRTVTRSRTLSKPTANAHFMAQVAAEAIQQLEVGEGVRLLGLTMTQLVAWDEVEQMVLQENPEADDVLLDRVTDEIRRRFGRSAVVPAPLIGPAGVDVMQRGDQQWGPKSRQDK